MEDTTKDKYPNLKRITKKEAKEKGKIGGIKSGIVRKENKDFGINLKIAIKQMQKVIAEQAIKKNDKQMAKDLNEVGLLAYQLVRIFGSKAIKAETRLKAIDMIANRIYGKVAEQPEEVEDDEITEPKFI